MQEVYDFIKSCGTYYIATVDGDQPRVRPFNVIDIFEEKLYIQTGRKKPVFQQVTANPKIEICACKGMEWIRIEAIAVLDDRVEAEVHVLDSNPHIKSMYAAGDGNNAVLYLKDATATFSSMKAEPRVVRF